MKREYDAQYLLKPDATSLHTREEICNLLNARANLGWELVDMYPVSIGYLVIFKRQKYEWNTK